MGVHAWVCFCVSGGGEWAYIMCLYVCCAFADLLYTCRYIFVLYRCTVCIYIYMCVCVCVVPALLPLTPVSLSLSVSLSELKTLIRLKQVDLTDVFLMAGSAVWNASGKPSAKLFNYLFFNEWLGTYNPF